MSLNELTYKNPDWQDVSQRELTYDENAQPILKIKNFARGGEVTTLHGRKALANAGPALNSGMLYDGPNNIYYGPVYYGEDDFREGAPYNVGRWLNKQIEPDPDDHMNPFLLAALLGGGGWAAGKLFDKLTGTDTHLSTIGLIGGGLLGATRGFVQDRRKQQKEASAKGIEKSAMYADPRNYVLERLQGATDISPFEKAQLAARIREMNWQDAERLKAQVRAAVGFGVGALIARWLGKKSPLGMMVGGTLGMFASKLWPKGGNRPAAGIFSGNYY